MTKVRSYNSNSKGINKAWNTFVLNHPNSHCYHLIEWKDIIEQAFGLQSFYLYAVEDSEDKICGVLPLIFSKSILFGRYLTSIPFFNYCGVLGSTADVEQVLLEKGIELAKRNKASHIEFRHCNRSSLELPTKTHKVRMVLELPDDSEVLWKGFKAKLRSQIKRAQRESMVVKFGCEGLVNDFYEVFSINMRDLGTPVWTKKIFQQVVSKFPEKSKICVIYLKNQPIAAGFLVGFKDHLEIPSASSLREFNRLSPNMLLYWSVLEFACKQGYKNFDFGRSSPDGGTFKFKKQWGALPETLHWQYWLSEGETLPELNPQNPKYRMMIKTWQKIPVNLTKMIGPSISRHLP